MTAGLWILIVLAALAAYRAIGRRLAIRRLPDIWERVNKSHILQFIRNREARKEYRRWVNLWPIMLFSMLFSWKRLDITEFDPIRIRQKITSLEKEADKARRDEIREMTEIRKTKDRATHDDKANRKADRQ